MEHIIKMAPNCRKICWEKSFMSMNSNLLSHFYDFVTECLYMALKVGHKGDARAK